MAIFDIFKKKKPAPVKTLVKKEKEKKIKKAEKPVKVKIAKKVEVERKETVKPKVKKERKFLGIAYKVLKSPHITEKATKLTEENKYIFKVWSKVNKPEIRKAVEDLYGVDVLDVKVINMPAKKRRRGRTIGEKSGFRKAIVKIKEGQKIELLPR